jgi:hypothetical protein
MSGEHKLKNINFFICSTYKDLKTYRETVIKKIQSSEGIINAQEFFGARDKRPIETCLEEVRKSHIFILIVGMRYGSIVNGKSKSFVELEYDEAKKLNKPIFAYIIDEAHPFPILYVDRDSNAKKLVNFKTRLLDDYTVDKFTTQDDLADKVIKDLLRDLPKKGYPINEKSKKLTEISNNIKDTITIFKTLPKMYYGKEFSIDVKFEGFERASKSECEALSLSYGASVKRKIIPNDEDIKNILSRDLSMVYAQYALAEKLVKYEMYKAATIKVKTTQGVASTKKPIYKERPNTHMMLGNSMYISGYEISEDLLIGLELLELR